jgi:hypothetical protein
MAYLVITSTFSAGKKGAAKDRFEVADRYSDAPMLSASVA